MENFIDIYLNMDRDENGFVDKAKFLAFCEKEQLEKSMVDAWMSHLDTNNDGRITFDEFCRHFGLKSQEMMEEIKERSQIKSGLQAVFPAEIQMVNSKMSRVKQVDITTKFIELLGKSPSDNEIEDVKNKMKAYLDEKYGRIWQVIVFDGSSWMNVTHEPIHSLQFHCSKYTVVVWRIPSDT